MTRFGLIAILAVVTFASSCGLPLSISASHVDANVPDPADFDRILIHDLTEYVTDSDDKGISVKYEMLRDRPSQSGVALPKFYCWLQKLDADGNVIEEAAIRMAAVDKTHFDVIQYFEKDRIIREPEVLKGVFPADVIEKIMAKVQPK